MYVHCYHHVHSASFSSEEIVQQLGHYYNPPTIQLMGEDVEGEEHENYYYTNGKNYLDAFVGDIHHPIIEFFHWKH